MPDEKKGKQRWREVPPLSDDERWILDNPPPLPPPAAPPPLPQRHAHRPSSDPPPLEIDDDGRAARHSAGATRRSDSFRPPDELLTEAVRRQRVAARPKPIGSNTLLAAVLAIGAIVLMVALTIFLAKRT